MRKHAAFPIVVSAEDAYPGHGKVDAVQEVSSVWSLLESFTATVTTDAPETAGTVVQKGMTVTAVPARGYYADGATVTPEGAAVVTPGGRPVPHLVPARGLHDHDPLLCQDASCAALCRAERCHAGRDSELCRRCRDPAASRRDSGSGCAGLFLCGLVPAGAGGAGREPVLSPRRSEFAVAQPEQTLYAVYRYFATPAGTTPAFHELTEAPEDWSGTYVLSCRGPCPSV